jgi:hypothetical protein
MLQIVWDSHEIPRKKTQRQSERGESDNEDIVLLIAEMPWRG